MTTHQAGKLALLGWRGSQPSLLMREFTKPMGLAVAPGKLALATRHEITLPANAPLLAPDLFPDQPGRYDALDLPRATYHTGDLNVHDLSFGTDRNERREIRPTARTWVIHCRRLTTTLQPAGRQLLSPEGGSSLARRAAEGSPRREPWVGW